MKRPSRFWRSGAMMPTEAAEKRRVALLTVAIPAIVGFLGGVISGGVTAYVQLTTKKEEYSIKRAQEFRGLMKELSEPETARLALLNLWQLYPEERDRRIITAAAFAVDQPDLVELVAGIDDQVDPVADVLHVRALSDDPAVHEPALQTLINVHPSRAAAVLIDMTDGELDVVGGKLPQTRRSFSPVQELERLAAQDRTVADMVADKTEGKWGVFYQYLLYRAGRESQFVQQMVRGYGGAEDLDLTNDYMFRGRFFEQDRPVVIAAAAQFITTHLQQETRDDFALVGTFSALKNPDFFADLNGALGAEFTQMLHDSVVSAQNRKILRKRALELLDVLAPHHSSRALLAALALEGPTSQIGSLAETYLSRRRVEQLIAREPHLLLPDCQEQTIMRCIQADPQVWSAWAAKNGLE